MVGYCLASRRRNSLSVNLPMPLSSLPGLMSPSRTIKTQPKDLTSGSRLVTPPQVATASLMAAAEPNRLAEEYAARREEYAQLCSEVEYLCRTKVREKGIEVAHVTARVKTLTSLAQKALRKGYADPMKEATDIAGVRVVYLYESDLPRLTRLVRGTFQVNEEVGKTTKDVDRFGYSAQHFVVTLKRSTSGARFRELHDLCCEIQIRTVLQDAWAIIDHHLRYKSEAQIPSPLRRGIHALAAILENADSQFAGLRRAQRRYLRQISRAKRSLDALLDLEVNRDTLREYLSRKFPNWKVGAFDNHLNIVLAHINPKKYKRIRQIDEAIDLTEEVRKNYNDPLRRDVALSHVAIALGCLDSEYRERTIFGGEAHRIIHEYLGEPWPPAPSTRKRKKRNKRKATSGGRKGMGS